MKLSSRRLPAHHYHEANQDIRPSQTLIYDVQHHRKRIPDTKDLLEIESNFKITVLKSVKCVTCDQCSAIGQIFNLQTACEIHLKSLTNPIDLEEEDAFYSRVWYIHIYLKATISTSIINFQAWLTSQGSSSTLSNPSPFTSCSLSISSVLT